MVVLDIKANNFYAFNDFHANFTYPKKIIGSYIENEHLAGFQNFRYKKVNIIMGANASGKTSLGFFLRYIFLFIKRKELHHIVNMINNKDNLASFSLEIIPNGTDLYRIECKIYPTNRDDYDENSIDLKVSSVKIKERDSYENCLKRLDKSKEEHASSYMEELTKVGNLSWYFEHPADSMSNVSVLPENDEMFLEVLKRVMPTIDPSIHGVEKINSVKNAYVLRIGSRSVIIQDDNTISSSILSSGTKSGIAISSMLSALVQGKYGFYYCDEKFSYIHSEIEKAILSVMIDSIKSNEQLFFTTHNTDILDMDLPKHSYVFLKKQKMGDKYLISCLSASDFLKRNTDSLRRAVENDVFSTAPSTEKIFEIPTIVNDRSDNDEE